MALMVLLFQLRPLRNSTLLCSQALAKGSSLLLYTLAKRKLRRLLRKAPTAGLDNFQTHTTRHTFRYYHSGYSPFHINHNTPALFSTSLPDDISEDSHRSEERRARNPLYVFLDTLRHFPYLWVKTPLELSREVLTSSHNMGYTPRTIHHAPDAGYIRVNMCCWKDGCLLELGLYDDIPVYCGGRLPYGRMHFSLTRELWQLPNIAVIDTANYNMYQIREPLSLAVDELEPFILRGFCLPVIGSHNAGIDIPSPGLVKIRLIRLYIKRKTREYRTSLRQACVNLENCVKYSCLGKEPPDFEPWTL
ncbi:hypothetical protein BDY19DRAFT_907626 [Irpex rosettiformis]|uniref:Uncharacterized protein n=1 Tax=Irpex rosettiformis TaxID=378272 RepID=A0ACB8TYB3_9APHY|nr:hypothetical protein BDY19DRAFT_907626 [Irpex rosettiformis]